MIRMERGDARPGARLFNWLLVFYFALMSREMPRREARRPQAQLPYISPVMADIFIASLQIDPNLEYIGCEIR
jgi:hypothetical protein